jgi:hypothetical protein
LLCLSHFFLRTSAITRPAGRRDGRRVEYIFEDKHVIVAGSLEIDADTVKPADFSKTYKKGKWWAMYCLKDFHLYVIAEVLPGQIKNK